MECQKAGDNHIEEDKLSRLFYSSSASAELGFFCYKLGTRELDQTKL